MSSVILTVVLASTSGVAVAMLSVMLFMVQDLRTKTVESQIYWKES